MNILIVEDKKEEQKKAYAAVQAAGHACAKAHDLHQALLFLEKYDHADDVSHIPTTGRDREHIEWGGVITDLHYPGDFIEIGDMRESGETNYPPNGLTIAAACNRLGIPCVICTDVHHHNSFWIKHVARQLGIPVIDDKGEKEDAWQRAVEALLKEIENKAVAT